MPDEVMVEGTERRSCRQQVSDSALDPKNQPAIIAALRQMEEDKVRYVQLVQNIPGDRISEQASAGHDQINISGAPISDRARQMMQAEWDLASPGEKANTHLFSITPEEKMIDAQKSAFATYDRPNRMVMVYDGGRGICTPERTHVMVRHEIGHGVIDELEEIGRNEAQKLGASYYLSEDYISQIPELLGVTYELAGEFVDANWETRGALLDVHAFATPDEIVDTLKKVGIQADPLMRAEDYCIFEDQRTIRVYRALLTDEARQARRLANEFAEATLEEEGATSYARGWLDRSIKNIRYDAGQKGRVDRTYGDAMKLFPLNPGVKENFAECSACFTEPAEGTLIWGATREQHLELPNGKEKWVMSKMVQRTADHWRKTRPRSSAAHQKIKSFIDARHRGEKR